jgi:hypothetical protein
LDDLIVGVNDDSNKEGKAYVSLGACHLDKA